jgi:hypothetical protein
MMADRPFALLFPSALIFPELLFLFALWSSVEVCGVKLAGRPPPMKFWKPVNVNPRLGAMSPILTGLHYSRRL